MSLETKVSELIDLETKNLKKYTDEYDKRTAFIEGKGKEVDGFITSAKQTMPFINLIKNPHMVDKDENGNFINIPCSFFAFDMESYRIIDSSVDDVPQAVKDYISGGIVRGHGNVLELKMTSHASLNLWLAANSISGLFSSGWKWVYVESGKLRDIEAGTSGSFFDVKNINWNIDVPLGNFDDNSVIYLAHPFVVAGGISSVNEVKTMNDKPDKFIIGG